MDGPAAAVLVPLARLRWDLLLSSPGAGCLTHPSRRLGATAKAGPAEAEGVSVEAAGGTSVEGSDCRGPGPEEEAQAAAALITREARLVALP